ncbi:hypothetical protein [Streptomyces hydrogenans]|uniref:hypothetical protein n=1 Tax=Streptomyces hydrogenans TaxID=1873719 RepID=UPI003814CD15
MSEEAASSGGEKSKCPGCGKAVKYDIIETTAMGSGGGRERIRGVARCTNPRCDNQGLIVKPV